MTTSWLINILKTMDGEQGQKCKFMTPVPQIMEICLQRMRYVGLLTSAIKEFYCTSKLAQYDDFNCISVKDVTKFIIQFFSQ